MRLPLLILFLSLLSLTLGDASTPRREEPLPNPPPSSTNITKLPYFSDPSLLTLLSPETGWYGAPPAPAADDVWKRYICKGRKMIAQMSYSDYDVGRMLPNPQTTAQSPYNLHSMLNWGYQMYASTSEYRDFQENGFWGIAPWLRDAGVSDKCVEEGGKWHAAIITHWDPLLEERVRKEDQTYVDPNGVKRRVSGKVWCGVVW